MVGLIAIFLFILDTKPHFNITELSISYMPKLFTIYDNARFFRKWHNRLYNILKIHLVNRAKDHDDNENLSK